MTEEPLCDSCARAKDPSIKDAPESLSFEELSAEFERCIQHLQTAECHEALTQFFDHEHKVNITQCICLALGSFGTRRHVKKSFGEFTDPLHQLAVLTVLLQVLRTKHEIPNIYFQDPVFQPVEVQFLESFGYIVLEDPDAFDKTSASTFLFAPHCPYDVGFMALKSSFPALYIGNDPRAVGWDIIHDECGLCGSECARVRLVDTFFRFHVSTRDDDSKNMMMPAFDRPFWVTTAQVRWLHPDYKTLDKGYPIVFFFLVRVFAFLLMVWRRVRCQRVSDEW